jgi:hypothetical protein
MSTIFEYVGYQYQIWLDLSDVHGMQSGYIVKGADGKGPPSNDLFVTSNLVEATDMRDKLNLKWGEKMYHVHRITIEEVI